MFYLEEEGFENCFTLKKKEQLTLSFSVPKMLAKYSAILLARLAASEILVRYQRQLSKAILKLISLLTDKYNPRKVEKYIDISWKLNN